MNVNYPCTCGHSRSKHNYRDEIIAKVKEDYKKQLNPRHPLDWYIQAALNTLGDSECNVKRGDCFCDYFEGDNLKYLEQIAIDKTR